MSQESAGSPGGDEVKDTLIEKNLDGKNDRPKETLKKFVFTSKTDATVPRASFTDTRDFLGDELNRLEVLIPETLHASYGLYVWPCAPVLAWYLFEHRNFILGKRILELGAGTALPGITAALCGASVTLSDSAKLPHCLNQCKKSVNINNLGGTVKIIGITWGLFIHPLTRFKNQLDWIISSDCFYDPSVFEDLVSTVAYLLENNTGARFLCTYQVRSSDWTIAGLLKKWKLSCKHVPLAELAARSQVDLFTLMQGHTIQLLEITRSGNNSS